VLWRRSKPVPSPVFTIVRVRKKTFFKYREILQIQTPFDQICKKQNIFQIESTFLVNCER